MRGQSDQNIRKLRDTYTRKLQRKVYGYLTQKTSLTHQQQEIVESFLLYHDYDDLSMDAKNAYLWGMAAFEGVAPIYHISLPDKPATGPAIVWDFYSLLSEIQLIFSFTLEDEEHPRRLCEHCQKVFVAHRPNDLFCSLQCRNRHNANRSNK